MNDALTLHSQNTTGLKIYQTTMNAEPQQDSGPKPTHSTLRIVNTILLAGVVGLQAMILFDLNPIRLFSSDRLDREKAEPVALAKAPQEGAEAESRQIPGTQPVTLWRVIPVQKRLESTRRLEHEIDRMFHAALSDMFSSHPMPFYDGAWDNLFPSPAMDMREQGTNYVISISMPGAQESEIQVDLKGQLLTVSTQRGTQDPAAQTSGHYAHTVRLKLPSPVHSDMLRSDFKDDVLQITVPRKTDTETINH